MRVREDFKNMAGTEKAALLVLSLGDDHAAKLFSLLDEDEIKELSQTMANLGAVSSQVMERLFVDFAEQISSTGSMVGSFESTERLLKKVLDEEHVDTIMEEIRGPAGRTMWDKLGNVNETVLANYLKNEYPQTVAVVMSKIKPAHAARVLGVLPENFAMEVVMRMLRMETVQKEVLDDIERTLRTEFMTNLSRAAGPRISSMIVSTCSESRVRSGRRRSRSSATSSNRTPRRRWRFFAIGCTSPVERGIGARRVDHAGSRGLQKHGRNREGGPTGPVAGR